MTRGRKLLNAAFEGKAGSVCAARPRSAPGRGPGRPPVLRRPGGLGEGRGALGCSWPGDGEAEQSGDLPGSHAGHLISSPIVQFSVVQFFSPLCSSVSENPMFSPTVVSSFVTESAMGENKQNRTPITIFRRLEMQGVAYGRHNSSLTHTSFLAILSSQVLTTGAKSDSACLIFFKQTDKLKPNPPMYTALLCPSALSPGLAGQGGESWLALASLPSGLPRLQLPEFQKAPSPVHPPQTPSLGLHL